MLLPQLSQAQTDGELFLAAKNAALHDNWPVFTELKDKLSNYPLLPYLEFYQIEANLKTTDAATVQNFLDKYPNSPMAHQLQDSWLNQLAATKNWQGFLAAYQPNNNVGLQCNYLYALQQTGKAAEAAPQITPIWLNGESQPDNCNPVFDAWLATAPDKNALIWKRFQLALSKYNFGLANFLSDKMMPQEKNNAQAIVRLYVSPALVIDKAFLAAHPSPEVISYGIARLARQDSASGIKAWEQLKNKYAFTEQQKQRIFQSIALKLAMRKSSQSLIWFHKIVSDHLEPVYESWLVRAGLYHGDWNLVKERILAMPEDQRLLPEWRYWFARAVDNLGETKIADNIFTELARDRNYYGFLSSEQLKQPIKINNTPPPITTAEVTAVEHLPGFQRAELLYQLKQDYDASSEIYYLLKTATPTQQYIIVKLISKWNWFPQTLVLSSKTVFKNDVTLRFPLLYQNTVLQNAELRKIDAALIYAIIRQESYFGVGSISPAGAIGLMQLMPTTAARTSTQFRIKYSGVKELLNADTNIEFGSAHLKQSIGDFGGNPILAIAAYNAGPDAVNRWIPKDKKIPADIWIETIPYHETRNYIKNVLANYIVYQYRLGQKPDLHNIMLAVNSTTAGKPAEKIKK